MANILRTKTNSSFSTEERWESGAHISCMRTVSFKWTHFLNAGPRRGLSILSSWQGMGWCTLSPGEPIHQSLLDKASLGSGIRGMPTPSSAIGGYLDMGS